MIWLGLWAILARGCSDVARPRLAADVRKRYVLRVRMDEQQLDKMMEACEKLDLPPGVIMRNAFDLYYNMIISRKN